MSSRWVGMVGWSSVDHTMAEASRSMRAWSTRLHRLAHEVHVAAGSCRPCSAMPPSTPPGVTSTPPPRDSGRWYGGIRGRWRCGTISGRRSPDLEWAGEMGATGPREIARTNPPTRRLREGLRRLDAERFIRSAPVGDSSPLTCVDRDRPSSPVRPKFWRGERKCAGQHGRA
jgi:hypothetical protein